MRQLTTTDTATTSAPQWTSTPTQSNQALSPAEVEDLLARLGAEAKKRRTHRRIKVWIVGGYIAVVLISLIVRLVTEAKFSLHMPFIQMWWLLGGLGAASKLQKESVRKLAKMPDIRGIGYFVDALGFADKDVTREAAEALLILLPQLKASDAHLLNDEQRSILYKQIRGKDTKLILAILKALEQVGDEKAVPFVQERIDRKHSSGDVLRIQTAAQECMPALKARVEQERAAHTLLRATTANESDSDVLLRPAAGAGADSTILLQPVESLPDTDHERQPLHDTR